MFPRISLLSVLFAGLVGCDADGGLATSGDDPVALAPVVEAAQTADALFIGTVVAIEPRLSEPDAEGRVVPFQFVTWEVERASFGVEDGQAWTGRFAGGALPDGRTLWVSEVPEFALGQRALVAATHGDHGSCALVGCRDGMVLLDGVGGDWDRAAASLVDGLVDDARPLARSADPDRPFAFLGAPRAGTAGLEAAHARGRARLSRPRVSDVDPDEAAALEANGGDPVLPR